MAQYNNKDRFGNAFKVVGCKPNKNGFSVGYTEINGVMYKLEPSPSNKDGVDTWIRITKMPKRKEGGSF